MIKILSSAQMQACDRAAIQDVGIPGIVLMENAGLQTVECILEHFDGPPPSVVVLCGKGNNGGDGLVIARHLHNAGVEVVAVVLGDAGELAPDAATNYRIVRAMDVPVVHVRDEAEWKQRGPDLAGFACIVDAVLGTGARGGARGLAATVIAGVNDAEAPVVAVDLPSGMDADAGALPGPCVIADMTVTFGAPKCCHVLEPASTLCGELAVVDISIPAAVLERSAATLRLCTEVDWSAAMPSRARDSHKGSHGTVLVIGGSVGTAGAAVLAARAALRGGAGLVHLACPETVYAIVGPQITEALVHPLPVAGDGGLGEEAANALGELVAAADVLAIGPGLGTAGSTMATVRALASGAACPAVIDADGLAALLPAAALQAPAPRVLTPHPGEAARLLGCTAAEVQGDRVAALHALVERTRCIVVLKGHRTLIGAPDTTPVVNPTGNPGLAAGGTGDVLTGLVAALVGQGLEPFTAAWAGAFLHGRAGDLVAGRFGEAGLTAGDLAAALPLAMRQGDGDELVTDA